MNMIKQQITRVSYIILSFCLTVSCFSGCGKKDSPKEPPQPVEMVTDAVPETVEPEENSELEVAKRAEENAKHTEEQAILAEEETKKTEEARINEERLKAEAEAKKAEEETKQKEEERLKAEAEAKKAEEERIKAEQEAKRKEDERLKAEAEAKKAEEERILAEKQAEKDAIEIPKLTALSMLNYMTVLTQKINASSGDQIFLEEARNSLYNDTKLNAIDSDTQTQINRLVETIDKYRMVSVKRERIEYIYDQNKAQAFRQAIPNPMGLLSTVESKNMLETAASVVYMTIDSVMNYQSTRSQAELQFIKEGWELDDADTALLRQSTTDQFNYMCNMAQKLGLDDAFVVRNEDVQKFADWADDTNTTSKIAWLEDNEKKYAKFGPYWLELAKDYYNSDPKNYVKCLSAVSQYEDISAKIKRTDIEYANTLPMAIISAKNTMSEKDYIEAARMYCKAIEENIKDENWELRYYIAQVYLDLYGMTNQISDLKTAYRMALYNVNILKNTQLDLNDAYKAPVVEIKTEKNSTKRQQEEIKQYNKLIKEERKVTLPPVCDALYLNCDLLFAIADKLGIDATEKQKIENILHENGKELFLTKALDCLYHYNSNVEPLKVEELEILFDKSELMLPASCISERSEVTVSVETNGKKTLLDDWTISEVKRPKNADVSEFTVRMNSKKGRDYKYAAGDKIQITVLPAKDTKDNAILFSYEVVPTKIAFVINGFSFNRTK